MTAMTLRIMSSVGAWTLGVVATSAAFGIPQPSAPSRFKVVVSDGLQSFQTVAPKNLSIVDWNNPVRDQSVLGSCQSFSFIGMLENFVADEQHVSVDLSERYQLFANFMHFGAMGSSPSHLMRISEVLTAWGATTEAAYPYGDLLLNQAAFAVDTAQGLDAAAEPAIDEAIRDKTAAERFAILQEPRFFGAAPGHVEIPTAAGVQNSALVRVVEVIGTKTLAPCFTADPAYAGPRLSLTPVQFSTHCLRYSENAIVKGGMLADQQFAGNSDEVNYSDEAICDPSRRSALTETLIDLRKTALSELLDGIVAKRATMIAVPVPTEGGALPVWRQEGTATYAGHAVTAVGFVTAQDLATAEAQSVGLLASGLFDRFAALHDPTYLAPKSEMTASEAATVRSASSLGQIAQSEQGLIVVRNSWGAVVGDNIPVGLDGYQLMTFDYFLSNDFLIMKWDLGRVMKLGSGPALETTDRVLAANQVFADEICTAPTP